MKKNEKKNEISRNFKIVLISFILVFFIGLIIYARNFRNFSTITLMSNKKTYYNVSDLVVNDIKYLDNEKTVEKKLGKPKKESTKVIGNYLYKIKKYDGLTITLKEDYSDFKVSKVEVTGRKYKTGRKIKVGNKITKVFRSYKVKNKKGNYMYGNYTAKVLNDRAVKKEVYFGHREKDYVEYVIRDAITDSSSPVMTSRVRYDYKYGKIRKITWSYDVE